MCALALRHGTRHIKSRTRYPVRYRIRTVPDRNGKKYTHAAPPLVRPAIGVRTSIHDHVFSPPTEANIFSLLKWTGVVVPTAPNCDHSTNRTRYSSQAWCQVTSHKSSAVHDPDLGAERPDAARDRGGHPRTCREWSNPFSHSALHLCLNFVLTFVSDACFNVHVLRTVRMPEARAAVSTWQ